MRTNIDIDDRLLRKAMKVGRTRTKRAAVDDALREYVRVRDLRRAFERVRGTGWQGDLNRMRKARTF